MGEQKSGPMVLQDLSYPVGSDVTPAEALDLQGAHVHQRLWLFRAVLGCGSGARQVSLLSSP